MVVTECGSCSAFLKDYPELFENDPAWQKRAKELNKKVKGFSEFMVDRLPASAAVPKVSAKVTYHDPCHMSRYQKVVSQPRALLKKIPGVNYVELPEADRCCGAAGSYNVMHYEQSMRVLERKVENVKKTGAEILEHPVPRLHHPAALRGQTGRTGHPGHPPQRVVREAAGKK